MVLASGTVSCKTRQNREPFLGQEWRKMKMKMKVSWPDKRLAATCRAAVRKEDCQITYGQTFSSVICLTRGRSRYMLHVLLSQFGSNPCCRCFEGQGTGQGFTEQHTQVWSLKALFSVREHFLRTTLLITT